MLWSQELAPWANGVAPWGSRQNWGLSYAFEESLE